MSIKTTSLTKFLFFNLGIGFLVFYLLGAQFKEIGFHADDYGLIRHGQCNSTSDIKRIFKHGDIMHSACFSQENLYPLGRPSYLEVIYRPLLLLIMGAEFKAFGLKPYVTHLIHIGFHTITTLALFNVLACITIPSLAALCSLFFAFHSSLKDYFFWQCYIQNSLEGFFLVLICLFIYLFYRRRQTRWLISASATFFLALLLRETLIFLPLLIVLGWFVFSKINDQKPHLKNFLLGYSPYMVIPPILYTFLRCWAYPLSSHIARIGIKELKPAEPTGIFLRNKFYDLLTYFFDLIGIKWIPSGFAILKFIILILVGGALFIAWKSSLPHRRLVLIFLGSCVLLLSWPSIVFFHSSRYLYLPTLFLAILLAVLLHPFITNSRRRGMILFSLGAFVLVQGLITVKTMALWCTYIHKEMLVYQNLAHLSYQEKKIVTVGISPMLGTGNCSAPVIMGARANHLYEYDHELPSRAAIGNDVSIADLFKSFLGQDKLHIKSLDFKREEDILFIQTTSPDSLWFDEDDLMNNSLGNVEITEQIGKKILAFKIHIDGTVAANTMVLGWKHEQGTFEQLN